MARSDYAGSHYETHLHSDRWLEILAPNNASMFSAVVACCNVLFAHAIVFPGAPRPASKIADLTCADAIFGGHAWPRAGAVPPRLWSAAGGLPCALSSALRAGLCRSGSCHPTPLAGDDKRGVAGKLSVNAGPCDQPHNQTHAGAGIAEIKRRSRTC